MSPGSSWRGHQALPASGLGPPLGAHPPPGSLSSLINHVIKAYFQNKGPAGITAGLHFLSTGGGQIICGKKGGGQEREKEGRAGSRAAALDVHSRTGPKGAHTEAAHLPGAGTEPGRGNTVALPGGSVFPGVFLEICDDNGLDTWNPRRCQHFLAMGNWEMASPPLPHPDAHFPHF